MNSASVRVSSEKMDSSLVQLMSTDWTDPVGASVKQALIP